ncbi:MAG: DUF885 domain-containing protein [Proteobacteria bacterium]|nr:DUF885 domain-containing protein [Pseudomonadota bacterium]
MSRVGFAFVLLLTVLLTACSGEPQTSTGAMPASSPSTTVAFNEWLDSEFEAYLDFYPQTRTRLGIKKDYGKLNEVSVDAMQRVLDWRRASVEKMKASFSREALDEQGKISWDLWINMLKQAEAAKPFWYHDTIFGWRGPHTSLPNSLINYHKVDNRDDLDAYLARLKEVDRQLGQYLDRAKAAYEKGIATSHSNYELAIKNSRRVIDGAPFNEGEATGLWRDINGKIDALVEAGEVSEPEADEYRAKFRIAMFEDVKPAYVALIDWLAAIQAQVDPVDAGASTLPEGEAYYQYRLQRMTTLPLTAEEIHQTGLDEVARIQAEMDEIRKTVGFEGSLQDFFVFMREDEQFYYPSSDEGRAAYLDLAREYLAGIEAVLPQYFDLLPKASLEVRRVEAFREQPGGAAHYARGTPDGSRPGVFYMHLIDMSAHPTYRIENLSYHEGLPGHHMQLSIQQELEGLPRFRGHHGYTAYSEGWGLYSEYLAKDMGFYESPYNDFGRLSGELWRAIRLVVDTGIHAKGWTEQQATEYAIANSAKSTAAATSEIKRYVYMPGQATAYKIGMMKILALRARAQEQLGDEFDYGEFHSVILGGGPMPLTLLESRVNDWLDDR